MHFRVRFSFSHAKPDSFLSLGLNGWNVRPQADVTLIPQLGDSKSKATLTNAYGARDTVNGEFSGKFGTNVALGVQADKGMTTIGARYGFTGGTKGKADHAFKIEARLRFYTEKFLGGILDSEGEEFRFLSFFVLC